jgi:hypothetical protein
MKEKKRTMYKCERKWEKKKKKKRALPQGNVGFANQLDQEISDGLVGIEGRKVVTDVWQGSGAGTQEWGEVKEQKDALGASESRWKKGGSKKKQEDRGWGLWKTGRVLFSKTTRFGLLELGFGEIAEEKVWQRES